jgi:hypothetical protein
MSARHVTDIATALAAAHRFVKVASLFIHCRPDLALWGKADAAELDRLWHSTLAALGMEQGMETGVGSALEALYADRLSPAKVGG